MAKATRALSCQSPASLFHHQCGLLLLAIRGGDNNLREVQGQLVAVAGSPSWGPGRQNTGNKGSQGKIPSIGGERFANHGIHVLDRSDTVKDNREINQKIQCNLGTKQKEFTYILE